MTVSHSFKVGVTLAGLVATALGLMAWKVRNLGYSLVDVLPVISGDSDPYLRLPMLWRVSSHFALPPCRNQRSIERQCQKAGTPVAGFVSVAP